MTTTAIIILVLAVILVCGVGLYLFRKERSKKLRSRFGPEYDHALHQYGSRTRAAAQDQLGEAAQNGEDAGRPHS